MSNAADRGTNRDTRCTQTEGQAQVVAAAAGGSRNALSASRKAVLPERYAIRSRAAYMPVTVARIRTIERGG